MTQTTRLDRDELIAEARRITGLHDFGEPDVYEPLSVLIPALNDEAQLSAAGMIGQRVGILRSLVNRLRIEDALTHHPEIRDEPIRGPVVIVGMPRSGTTKLQRMLAAGGELQYLTMWKMMNPAPFPDALAGGRDPRIAAAEEMVALMHAQFPEFNAMHPIGAQDADEEVFLMQLSFISSMPMHGTKTPSYKRWMVAQDCSGWYRYFRTLLQYFQWQDGSPRTPWLIKAPWHFRWMPLLFSTFPDATVVHCYRSPLQTIPSLASLIEGSRRTSSDLEQPREVGEVVLDYWGDAVRRFLRDRPLLDREQRFLDVAYTDIVGDTSAVIRRIHDKAGVPLTHAALAAMQAWEHDNPQHKHGRHAYSMERYGYSEALIRERFGDYMQRFDAL